jgi:hypothetical protein
VIDAVADAGPQVAIDRGAGVVLDMVAGHAFDGRVASQRSATTPATPGTSTKRLPRPSPTRLLRRDHPGAGCRDIGIVVDGNTVAESLLRGVLLGWRRMTCGDAFARLVTYTYGSNSRSDGIVGESACKRAVTRQAREYGRPWLWTV